jgi:hypothetical protein
MAADCALGVAAATPEPFWHRNGEGKCGRSKRSSISTSADVPFPVRLSTPFQVHFTGYWFPFGSRTGVNCTEAIRHLSACRTNTAVVPMDVVRLGVSYVSVIRPVSIAVSP